MTTTSGKMKRFLKRHSSTIKRFFPTTTVNWVIRQYVSKFGNEELGKALGIHPDVFKVWPGHFYSVFPDIPSIKTRWDRIFNAPTPYGTVIPDNTPRQLELAAKLRPYIEDYGYFANETGSGVEGCLNGKKLRYSCSNDNATFHLDSVVLQAMLRYWKPKRVIEMGSGYSSAIMLDTREREGWIDLELTFIEPFSQEYFFPLLRKEDREVIRIIELPIWDVEDSVFAELDRGDLLFIDSSHVAKIGSDVHHYVFNILPKLRSGVIIHIHDIQPNFECATSWFNNGWFWNEGSLIKAFLMYNTQFEILFHSGYLHANHPDADGVREIIAQSVNTFQNPKWMWMNSLYLRKV